MLQEKIHVGARVPKDFVDICIQKYGNMTNAINIALELLLNHDENKTDERCQQNENICQQTENIRQQNENSIDLLELKIRMEEKDIRTKEFYEQIKIKDGLQESRIKDLLDQLLVKDQQLEKKDMQIENLTNAMQSQAINIHDMLNQKTIEAPGAKQPWWRFW